MILNNMEAKVQNNSIKKADLSKSAFFEFG